MRNPTHVVVDRTDGYVFRNDSSGELFNSERAQAFAEQRNEERKKGHATYQVYRLEPELTLSYDDSKCGSHP